MLCTVLFIVFAAETSLSADVNFNSDGSTVTIRGIDQPFGRAFLGIPYAQPPLGQLRFAPAQPLQPRGFYDATQMRSKCTQSVAPNNSSEDCLYINVFTPLNAAQNSGLPVYMYIHPGDFVMLDSSMTGNGFFCNLVNRGPLILVTVAYRLGPFGFLTTRDAAAPGNAALTDWIAALQWIQRYIRFFGGDPSKVTIGGQGSGATAISFLTMTPQADNLYRAAILESGSAFVPMMMSYSDLTRNSSRVVALNSGCATAMEWDRRTVADSQRIIACLRSKSRLEILAAQQELALREGLMWGMVPDSQYLPDRLENLALRRQSIPVLQGTNSLQYPYYALGSTDVNLTQYNRQFVVNDLQNSPYMSFWNNQAQVYNAAMQKYIDPVRAPDANSTQWALTWLTLMSDEIFHGPVLRDAKYFAWTGSPVYLYSLDTQPASVEKTFPDPRFPPTVDLNYIFDYDPTTNQPIPPNSPDCPVKEIMGRLWTNFILYGNPTPSNDLGFRWDQIGPNNAYLSITNQPKMQQPFHPTAMFWVCNAPAFDGHTPPYCR